MEIEALDLVKVFSAGHERVRALDGVSASFRQGEIIVLLGPSGSGKTTLLNLLSGLDNPTTGRVMVDGHDLAVLPDRRKSLLRNRSFGFVFQFFNLLPEFTVLENVLIPTMVGRRVARSSRAPEDARRLLARVGLDGRGGAMPTELSGGEQQRVAVVRALVNSPGFVFADEPTGNLDRENAAACLEIFRDLAREANTSFIIATHNPEIAGVLGARVIRLKNGRIPAAGSG